jgi:glyoxylase-like metal-dependent hydrolase (beta-lactamase superfamily II)
MLKTTKYGEVTRFDLSRTIAGKGRYWTAAYQVDGLLVDTGCAHSAHELLRALRDTSLDLILNTHSHEDHIGANAALQRERDGLRALVHSFGIPVLADPRSKQPLHPYRRIYWGYPEPSIGQPIADGDVIETERYQFQVIYTPGHSPDHLCLYEPSNGWLFTGDLFVGGRERALRVDYDIWEIIASLKKISGLPSTTIFPGSARVREEPAEVLSAKIAYLEEFGERVLTLHRAGRSISSIVRELCGRPMFIETFTLGHFSRRGLVRSFLRGQPKP